jgi:phasin family protein
MADETKVEAQVVTEAAEAPAKVATVATEAPAKVAEVVAETVETVVKESAKAAKRTRKPAVRRVKREAVTQKVATKAAPRRTVRKTRKPARKVAAAAKERTQTVTKNLFNVDAIPAFAPFQSIMSEANTRGQDLVKRSQKVAEELADLARANVEAVVEAGRVASEGARSIGQEAVTSGRDSFEQAADAIRSLAEAKSPTEYLQLQSDFARASFDRAVAESSRLTESLVKLAGEAFQPLSNRASANAERFNTLVA